MFLMVFSLKAQSPQLLNYQAVINDASGEAIANTAVQIQFLIRANSTSGVIMYSEYDTFNTNSYGLINAQIGSGTTTDDFSTLDWSNNTFFLEIGYDESITETFTTIGVVQLLTVPYAMHATTVEKTGGLSTIISENNDASDTRIINLADAIDPQDAVTKAYVDLLEARITALENAGGGTGTITCDNASVFTISGGSNCMNNPPPGSMYNVSDNGTDTRTIAINQIPPSGHKVQGNLMPNNKNYSMPLNPVQAAVVTPVPNTAYTGGSGMIGYVFGVMKTGIPFDPVAAEGWTRGDGSQNYEWNLEILSTSHSLVYDCNNGHDTSRYHYHGTPTEYMPTIENGTNHSQLIGYAADGFPIYYKYGYEDPNSSVSAIVTLNSSYCVKSGTRPGDGLDAPDGTFDGTYTADYEYIDGLGDLDACNGRFSVTPEYPSGIYCYYITDDYPSIPRCFVGTPNSSFQTIIP